MGNATASYETHCFNNGFNEGQRKTIGEPSLDCALNALPCILKSNGYKAYVEGYDLGVNCNNSYSGDVPENGDTHRREDGKVFTFNEDKWTSRDLTNGKRTDYP